MSATRSATNANSVSNSVIASPRSASRTASRPAPAPLLLTVADVAHMLAIGKTAVYHLIWNGELTPIRIGRSVRFTVTDIEDFIAQRHDHST
ncbi:MAG: hypothetical protein CL424_12425 [Acidimicrobiaceae bacterium]|nr:hypothetical protein [Acidimicrobiaceae bacterium]